MEESELYNVENLCKSMYEAKTEEERMHAQQSILILQSSIEYIPQCEFILQNSNSPYALLVASTSMLNLICTHWNALNGTQKKELRLFLYNILAQKGSVHMDRFVLKSLIQLICKIIKLGWFDNAYHNEVNSDIMTFLHASAEHYNIGLEIFHELVTEMNGTGANTNGVKISLTMHRRIAVSFRENSLLMIFKISLLTLKHIYNNCNNSNFVKMTITKPANLSLIDPDFSLNKSFFTKIDETQNLLLLLDNVSTLMIKILSFDFIGTNPDESSEEIGAIQVPTTWRSIIQSDEIVYLLFYYYKYLASSSIFDISNKYLEVLYLLLSVRRSIFSPEKERDIFLRKYIIEITSILRESLSNNTENEKAGLKNELNYHAFCRLLGKLKSNYQLSELIKIDDNNTNNLYKEWISLTCEFTVHSFNSFQVFNQNSNSLLLNLWSRLVSAVPYISINNSTNKNGNESYLQEYIPVILKAYVESRLNATDKFYSEAIEGSNSESVCSYENLLDDETNLQEQLDKLPVLCHFQYSNFALYFTQLFEHVIQQYQEYVNKIANNQSSMMGEENNYTSYKNMLEDKLAWMVYIIGSVLGGPQSNSSQVDTNGNEGGEVTDGKLSSLVYQVIQFQGLLLPSNNEITQNFQNETDEENGRHLELSILHYLSNFRRCYIGEQHGMPISMEKTSSTIHETTDKHANYLRMFSYLGKGDYIEVINFFVTHIINNLKNFSSNTTSGDINIISKSLELLSEIASGYSSSKILLSLPIVNQALKSHSQMFDLFFSNPYHMRARTTLYSILGKLIFSVLMNSDKCPSINNIDDGNKNGYESLTFDYFMLPLENLLWRLYYLPLGFQYKENLEVKNAIVSLARDLRGIVSATHNRSTFHILYKFLYRRPDISSPPMIETDITNQNNEFMVPDTKNGLDDFTDNEDDILDDDISENEGLGKVFIAALDIWYNDEVVTTSVLKFFLDLSNNKGQRILFDQHSVNGMLLFRQISQATVTYGTNIMKQYFDTNHEAAMKECTDVYKKIYKGIAICLETLSRALGGNYVNFGAFKLYKDLALTNALDMSLQMSSKISFHQILAYPKLKKAYFSYLETVFRLHLQSILELRIMSTNVNDNNDQNTSINETNFFIQLIENLHEGLNNFEMTIATQSASAIDSFATYYYNTMIKDTLRKSRKNKRKKRLEMILNNQSENIFSSLFFTVMNVILYGDMSCQYAFSRPVLSIVFCYEEVITKYQDYLMENQNPSNQEKIRNAIFSLFFSPLKDVKRNLEPENRDLFTQKLSCFRNSIRNILACG